MSTKKAKTRISILPKPKRRARSRKQQHITWLAQEIFAGLTVREDGGTDVATRAAHSLVVAKVFWATVDKEFK
jgi:hypothetical protein